MPKLTNIILIMKTHLCSRFHVIKMIACEKRHENTVIFYFKRFVKINNNTGFTMFLENIIIFIKFLPTWHMFIFITKSTEYTPSSFNFYFITISKHN